MAIRITPEQELVYHQFEKFNLQYFWNVSQFRSRKFDQKIHHICGTFEVEEDLYDVAMSVADSEV